MAPEKLVSLLRKNAIPCTEVAAYDDYLDVFLVDGAGVELAIRAERILSAHPEASWVKRVDNSLLRFHRKPPVPPNEPMTPERAAFDGSAARRFGAYLIPCQRIPEGGNGWGMR